MWFGTDNGLSRFDGYELGNYGVAEGLKNNMVNNFQLDHDAIEKAGIGLEITLVRGDIKIEIGPGKGLSPTSLTGEMIKYLEAGAVRHYLENSAFTKIPAKVGGPIEIAIGCQDDIGSRPSPSKPANSGSANPRAVISFSGLIQDKI